MQQSGSVPSGDPFSSFSSSSSRAYVIVSNQVPLEGLTGTIFPEFLHVHKSLFILLYLKISFAVCKIYENISFFAYLKVSLFSGIEHCCHFDENLTKPECIFFTVHSDMHVV